MNNDLDNKIKNLLDETKQDINNEIKLWSLYGFVFVGLSIVAANYHNFFAFIACVIGAAYSVHRAFSGSKEIKNLDNYFSNLTRK